MAAGLEQFKLNCSRLKIEYSPENDLEVGRNHAGAAKTNADAPSYEGYGGKRKNVGWI
jgi:hypothetical protein